MPGSNYSLNTIYDDLMRIDRLSKETYLQTETSLRIKRMTELSTCLDEDGFLYIKSSLPNWFLDDFLSSQLRSNRRIIESLRNRRISGASASDQRFNCNSLSFNKETTEIFHHVLDKCGEECAVDILISELKRIVIEYFYFSCHEYIDCARRTAYGDLEPQEHYFSGQRIEMHQDKITIYINTRWDCHDQQGSVELGLMNSSSSCNKV